MYGPEQIHLRPAGTILCPICNGAPKMRANAYLVLSAALLVSALSLPVNRETGEGIIAFLSYGARLVDALGDLVMPLAGDAIEPIGIAAAGPSQR